MGVLLTAVGGPSSLDDVGPFLLDIRGGRPTPDRLIDEFRERYRRIGGKSPLLEISSAQAEALEVRLNRDGSRYQCYVGMRNWHPYIRETVGRIVADGVDRIVVLPLTPYFSKRSVGTYFRAVEEGLRNGGRSIDAIYVRHWNAEASLVDAFAAKVEAGLKHLAGKGFPDPMVLFTAHSLPQKLSDEGDPYAAELEETMNLIRKQLPRIRSRMGWQSAGRTEEPWLGPPLEDLIAKLAEARETSILVVPFGFVSDHLEILYDIDIEAKKQAADLGIHLERTESLNTDPRFIEAMASAIGSAIRVGSHLA
jgi:protoporphyrin/coproporphyrin ferrochelatase